MNWEQIDNFHQRAKVFGGWLVKSYLDVYDWNDERGYERGYNWRESMAFVPDPKHEWKLEDE